MNEISESETDTTPTETPLVTADGQELKTASIPFLDRAILVALPELEQLAVMRLFSDQFAALERKAKAAGGNIDANVMIRMSARAISIVQSVMADDDDKSWIQDMLLSKEVRLTDVIPLINAAMVALREANNAGDNRAERRGKGKGKTSHLVTT
jgi:hypothetical protein